MRIMTDTNILVSAILSPSSISRKLLESIIVDHQLILCSYIINELHTVFEKKFPNKIGFLDEFLLDLSYELIYTPKRIEIAKYPYIRDNADLPILVSAIIADVDIFITGDKDFHSVNIEKPQIISLKEFEQLQ